MFDLVVNTVFYQDKLLRRAAGRYSSPLARIGAYVMRVAQNRIRSRTKSSKPGQSPTNRTGLLKHFIRFEVKGKQVAIGPVLLSKMNKPGMPPIPNVLERGGWVTHREKGRVYIAPRPYMRPALEAAIRSKAINKSFQFFLH